jgi:hypothetical protein
MARRAWLLFNHEGRLHEAHEVLKVKTPPRGPVFVVPRPRDRHGPARLASIQPLELKSSQKQKNGAPKTASLRIPGQDRTATALQCSASAPVVCEWCGCTTDGTNHGTVAECIQALEREVNLLRRALDHQQHRTQSEATKRTPWKVRAG